MQAMTLEAALSVITAAADARMQQWQGVGENKSPDDLIGELWESAGTGVLEAQNMADLIETAIETVNKARAKYHRFHNSGEIKSGAGQHATISHRTAAGNIAL